MKERSCILLLIIFLIGHGFISQSKGQVNGRWSGTVSEQSQVTGAPGIVSESMVSISYNNNVGTGTYTGTGILTVEGKVLGRTNCSGTGTVGFAELSFDKAEKTYTIQTAALIYTCTHLGASSDSGESYITIAYEPWDENPRVLAGSKMLVTDIPGGGKLTTTTTWNLVKQSDVELIVTPQKYDTWLPIPGRDEQTPGPEMMNVTLKLQDRNGGPASEKAKSFELRLSNTSKEKGITINMPLVPAAQQLPDLRFKEQTGAIITDEGQRMIISCPAGCLTTSFRIACYDGGAWTTLTAVAELETDSIKGELLVPGGEKEIRIPKRDVASNIASAWLTQNGNPGEADDIETSAGNSNNGDGLSAYEEYRGVISEGRHKRLDPQKKEMGVLLKKAEVSLMNPGISLFENAADFKVVRFIENEIGPDRRLNKNFKTAHVYDQYVQKLEKGACSGDASGENRPVDVLGKTPVRSDQVVVDVTKISRNYRASVANLAAVNRRLGTNVRMPYTELEDIANTVAHELAHGVNIDHHGLPSDEPNKVIPPPNQTVDIFHIYGDDGIEIIRTQPFPITGNIGLPGNDESGDLSCIMAYTSLYQWAYRAGMDGSLNYYAVPLLPVGKTLCTSNTCPDPGCINANNRYFGNSANGNCKSRLKLRD